MSLRPLLDQTAARSAIRSHQLVSEVVVSRTPQQTTDFGTVTGRTLLGSSRKPAAPARFVSTRRRVTIHRRRSYQFNSEPLSRRPAVALARGGRDNAAMSPTAQPPKPKRRWYQFSLKTLLVVVTLFCVTVDEYFHHIDDGPSFQRAKLLTSFLTPADFQPVPTRVACRSAVSVDVRASDFRPKPGKAARLALGWSDWRCGQPPRF